MFAFAKTSLGGASADAKEHGLVFGIDSSGLLTVSGTKTSGLKNAAQVDTAFPGAFSDLHNHPGNTTPSAGDIYNLISVNMEKPGFSTRYTLLANGTVYALVITDATRAAAFLDKYPPENTPGFSPRFPEKLFNEFADMKSYLTNIQGMNNGSR